MSRPTAVLLPGLLCDDAVWRAQCAALDFATCVVPSYGEADSLTQMALGVLRDLPQERVAVAGHSMGGRVALEMARMAPERIERIALLDSGIDALAEGEAGDNERGKRLALLRIAQQQGMRQMGKQWARGMVHEDRLDTPLFDEILDMIERATPAIFAAQIQALLDRPDASSVLAGLRCPTWLVCGRQDAWSPLARHERMQTLCPGSQLTVIEHSGHMSTMEQPDAVSRALIDWMALR